MTNKTTAELLAELREKLELAKEPGGEKAVAKRDKKGIPSARARIHSLVDPGSFLEIGALCKTPGDPDALFGDGVVTGHGTINGRPVGVFSHDQTVFQGSVGEMFGRKVARLMEWVRPSFSGSSKFGTTAGATAGATVRAALGARSAGAVVVMAGLLDWLG